MKKLLALVLVLSVASMASAAVLQLQASKTTDVMPSEMVEISVVCVADPGVDDFWMNIQGPGEFVMPGQIYAAWSSAAEISDGGYGPTWIFGANGIDIIPNELGTWYSVPMHCLGEGDVTIDLYDASGLNIVDTLVIHQIPEPMTMSLLGLGGLAMLRRRG
jgi:hypothetical protein